MSDDFAYLHPCRPKGAHPNHEHWIRIRLQRLEFAGHKCETCDLGEKDGVRLECHHRHYRTFGNESMSDVCILCHHCHEVITASWMRRRERILRRYRSKQKYVEKQEVDRIELPTRSIKPTPVKRLEIERIM